MLLVKINSLKCTNNFKKLLKRIMSAFKNRAVGTQMQLSDTVLVWYVQGPVFNS
jgi:hypothetical protein